jgi:FAD/FMN-containing dehydrogenase
MKTRSVTSWGRVLWPTHEMLEIHSRDDALPDISGPMLPYGNGRSYGDSNLNPDGLLLATRRLDRILAFDEEQGLLTCEGGVLLSDVLRRFVPRGWFPAVTPGTMFVTVGGAIANDVHGKNHHRAGSFGHQVLRFELLRSDGSRRVCSPTENEEWFAATIGGLGLTGLVTWAQIRLKRIAGPLVDAETLRFRSLEEFFEISRASAASHEYTAAWIDCAFSGSRLGRGLFERGNHAARPAADSVAAEWAMRAGARRERRVPFTPPFSLVNALTLKAFNTAYFHRPRADRVQALRHYRPFLFPLDAVLEWNRIYGPKGFYQYQCVVPTADALRQIRRLLDAIAASGMGSFLAVLKEFGAAPAAGLLSFPSEGTTLALDFPNRGPRLEALFQTLDTIVLDAGGRLYPAKDGRMGPAVFKAGYPQWQEFAKRVDPRFSSGFWRRVTGA